MNKLEEVSRNELLSKTKSQTITRYNKAAGYKGFSIIDIDTTSMLTTNSLRVTCRVGNYYDTVEMENILYWIQLEAEKNDNYQINTKGVAAAIMNSIDGMDIKVDCNCGDFCLEENTKIKLLNNSIVTIKQMKEMFDNNEELWVYSTDEYGDFKPGKVTNVWISGKSKEMVKVTLDNGNYVITTPNHKYMMRDGSYKEASELKEKDSLMALYFSYHKGYENVKRNSIVPIELYNHKVVKVEFIQYQEPLNVYDLEVETYHNFFVDAGVMLHNCYRMAYQATKFGYKYGKPENRPANITNPNDYGALCKHLTSMLSNKRWLQQVTSTVMDYIVKRIDDINHYLRVKPGEELTLPNELARRNARIGAYSKLFKDNEDEEDIENNTASDENKSNEDNNDNDNTNNNDNNINDQNNINNNENEEDDFYNEQ